VRGWGPSLPKIFGTSYMREQRTRNSCNQLLHDHVSHKQ